MQKPFLLCISHRGAMGHAPENTLSSISRALELGAPCLEIDVFYVDGHLIVFHDDTLDRTTNGSGLVSEQSFDYLRTLDAGDGQQIATLEEACELIAGRAALNIELKGPGTAAPVAALITDFVNRGWPQDAFLVSSFDQQQLREVKRLSRDIKLAVLSKQPADDLKFARDLGAYSIHPALDCVDSEVVEKAHNSGLQVYVFTVNEPRDIAAMHGLGVDGVFSNFPERVLENYAQPNLDGRWHKQENIT